MIWHPASSQPSEWHDHEQKTAAEVLLHYQQLSGQGWRDQWKAEKMGFPMAISEEADLNGQLGFQKGHQVEPMQTFSSLDELKCLDLHFCSSDTTGHL